MSQTLYLLLFLWKKTNYSRETIFFVHRLALFSIAVRAMINCVWNGDKTNRFCLQQG